MMIQFKYWSIRISFNPNMVCSMHSNKASGQLWTTSPLYNTSSGEFQAWCGGSCLMEYVPWEDLLPWKKHHSALAIVQRTIALNKSLLWICRVEADTLFSKSTNDIQINIKSCLKLTPVMWNEHNQFGITCFVNRKKCEMYCDLTFTFHRSSKTAH